MFDILNEIAGDPNKTVRMVEERNLIPGAEYYSAMIKANAADSRAKKHDRIGWYNNSDLWMQGKELVFLDPDNGLSMKKKAGQKDSEKYVLPEEIVRYYENGSNVVYYCHKGRRKSESWEKAKVDIKTVIRDAKIAVLTFRKGSHPSYIFVLHPDDYKRYSRILADFLLTPWRNCFRQETANGTVTGYENTGEHFEIELSDGNRILLEKLESGHIRITRSDQPEFVSIISPDAFERHLFR